MVLPWLGPRVAAAPLAARVAAYTVAWMGHAFVVQTFFGAAFDAYCWMGWIKRGTAEPALPLLHMLRGEVVGYFSWTIVVAFVQAWFNPTFSSWSYSFNYAALFLYHLPLMIAVDTWFFFAHRWLHWNKWAFRKFHTQHHRPDASLSVITSSYMSPVEGLLSVGIPLGGVAAVGCMVGNYHALLWPLHTILSIFVIGHSGYITASDELKDIALLLVSPFLLVQKCMCICARPMDHQWHHVNARVNFAVLYTWWDEAYGTQHPKLPVPSARLLFISTVGFYFTALGWAAAAGHYPVTFALLLLLNVMTPLPQLFLSLLGGRIAHFVTRLSIWDELRGDWLITYAAADEAGAFKPDSTKRYIFCYQPMGSQARGAWYTFAGKGKESPVKDLDVKLAVSREAWVLPLSQQIHCLYDCCDSSYKTLKSQLSKATPSSVCIPIGGFREGKYQGTYKVVAYCRRGFSRLAVETGAALVPVIGIGEPFVGDGRPATSMLHLFSQAMHPYRPHPIKVVFSEPITPKAGETADALHARYCEGLMRLAKQHDVPMSIVE